MTSLVRSSPSDANGGLVLGLSYKWVALGVTTVGALMFAIDGSIVVLALPAMMTDLHAELARMIWVLMGYSLLSTVALLTFGRLADLVGLVVLTTLRVRSSYLHVVLGLILVGVGSALFWAPSTSAGMGSAPRNRLGVASATLATWRNTGMVISYALSLAIAAAGVPAYAQNQLFLGSSVNLPAPVAAAFVDGMHLTLELSIAICALTAIGWWFAAAPADRPIRRDPSAQSLVPGE